MAEIREPLTDAELDEMLFRCAAGACDNERMPRLVAELRRARPLVGAAVTAAARVHVVLGLDEAVGCEPLLPESYKSRLLEAQDALDAALAPFREVSDA